MKISAEPVLASIHPETGARITTLKLTFPTFILAQFNTHRAFSRNTSSSRAIPFERLAATATFVPEQWPSAGPGMKGGAPLEGDVARVVPTYWEHARMEALVVAKALISQGVHKEIANRLLQPFGWTTAIVTSTTWRNWLGQRTHPGAQEEHAELARAVHAALLLSRETAKARPMHAPLVSDEDFGALLDREHALDVGVSGDAERDAMMASAGRCRRISYGREVVDDLDTDIARGRECLAMGHLSPLEHQALSWGPPVVSNFGGGWNQHRAMHARSACPIESEWTEGIE